MSRLSWARGLKRSTSLTYHPMLVAPLVGAWIETSSEMPYLKSQKVAPLVGAWIETINETHGGGHGGRASRGRVD